ncbi:hypothetical protein FE784_13140 [Paenibacillus hemerocallicola]|jgi:hypothetical protein|uniref:Cell filamentation protein Fic n=1 Tax=Paenibacillus hemerocallicola TaxID=1172614 RepID=A0A5C4TB82_9BACL|nr:hypothetical protein [Paenibacillus hemerocallicola]TNJ65860.1 hypothetical protein FE784_13140 [Paenibacillus hemerocallicola]
MNEEDLWQLQMECTRFFQNNPYSMETVEGISLRLGRKTEILDPVLGRLVSLSILEKTGNGSRSIYRYIEPSYSGDLEVQWNIN